MSFAAAASRNAVKSGSIAFQCRRHRCVTRAAASLSILNALDSMPGCRNTMFTEVGAIRKPNNAPLCPAVGPVDHNDQPLAPVLPTQPGSPGKTWTPAEFTARRRDLTPVPISGEVRTGVGSAPWQSRMMGRSCISRLDTGPRSRSRQSEPTPSRPSHAPKRAASTSGQLRGREHNSPPALLSPDSCR